MTVIHVTVAMTPADGSTSLAGAPAASRIGTAVRLRHFTSCLGSRILPAAILTSPGRTRCAAYAGQGQGTAEF